MAAPSGKEHVAGTALLDGSKRMHALPFPGEATEQDQRDRPLVALAVARVRADHQMDPLDLGVAAHIDEDRPVGEDLEVVLGVGHAPRLPRLVPAARILHEPAPPQRDPLPARHRSAVEARRLEAVRRPHHALRLDVEEIRHAVHGVPGEH